MLPIPIFTKASLWAGLTACSVCAAAPQAFYTVTAEIALARHQPRVAAVQYAAAAAEGSDTALIERAAQVAAECLQPSLVQSIAAHWAQVDPASVEAQRAAAEADLALQRIDPAAVHFRFVIQHSPLGAEAEFAALQTYLAGNDNIFGARQLADRLASWFPASAAALRMRGFAALRADDPAAAVVSLTAAAKLPGVDAPDTPSAAKAPDVQGAPTDADVRREAAQTLARARVMAGDVEGPLMEARERAEREDTPVNRLDYAMLLLTAQQSEAAIRELEKLAQDPQYAPVAQRLIGVIEFEQGHLKAATERFAALVRTDKFLNDAFYYLGLIADRQEDPEHALKLYAQVQGGENSVPALLRAAAILEAHGAAPAGEDLLDRLIEGEPQRAPAIIAARARIYADGGQWPRAVGVLKQGINEYPDSVELRYALASLDEDMGRITEAVRELKRLVKARPDDPAALNALGFTLADHSKQLARALRLIESAHAAAPKNAAILDSLGWVLFRRGRGADAEVYLREAYTEDRGGDIAAHLGEVLWREGRRADALQIWAEAGALDGENRLLKDTRHRLEN